MVNSGAVKARDKTEPQPGLDYGKMGLMHMHEIGPQVRRAVTQLQTSSVMMKFTNAELT